MANTKTRHKTKILEYLGDPENEFLSRTALALTVLGYKHSLSIYRIFTPQELSEIENEALSERKRRSTRNRAILYDALFVLGQSGNVQAIKEYLDRTEGKVTEKTEHTGANGGPIQLTDIERSKRIAALLDIAKNRRDGHTVSDAAS